MRRVRPLVRPFAFSLVLLASLFSGGSGEASADRTAAVIVLASGVMPEGEGPDSGEYEYAEYGLVLRNRSLTRDAIDVTVEVEAVDGGGQSLADGYTAVTLIPAGAEFVISGALIWRGSLGLAGIETEVHVGQTAPRRRRLPPVRHASVTGSGGVTGSLTNPYKKSLPESATIYGVVLDGRGRIVAAGYDLTDTATRPGATVAFDIRGNSTGVQPDAMTSAKVSVDPCGYLAFTRACPVPGAQS
jgi:hypothetical protein